MIITKTLIKLTGSFSSIRNRIIGFGLREAAVIISYDETYSEIKSIGALIDAFFSFVIRKRNCHYVFLMCLKGMFYSVVEDVLYHDQKENGE